MGINIKNIIKTTYYIILSPLLINYVFLLYKNMQCGIYSINRTRTEGMELYSNYSERTSRERICQIMFKSSAHIDES